MKTMIYVGNAEANGIDIFRLNRDSGMLEPTGRVLPDRGVAPMAASPDGRFLYVGLRGETPQLGAFAVDGESGGLHFLGSVPGPAFASYLHVDASGRFLLGASYSGGELFVLALGREGFIQPEPLYRLRPGRNPHCLITDPANRFAYAALLGNDVVSQFHFNTGTGALTPLAPPVVPTPREAGPRHMIFSPDGRFAFVLMELGGEILSCAADRDAGTLTPLHSEPLLPPDRSLPPSKYEPPLNRSAGGNSPVPVMWAADIRITPDGKYLYATERTNSTVSCFAVDPASGRLDLAAVIDTEGQPRGMGIEPFGRFALIAGERSGHASLYRIDTDTGTLAQCDRREVGSAPIWIESVVLPY